MKISKIILLFLILLLASCSNEFEQESGLMPPASGQVTFLLGLQEDGTAVQTRNGEKEKIARMWYAIADDREEILKPLYQKLEADFSKLTIEGLEYGDYTVVFLATTSAESDATINEPEQLSDAWLLNQAAKAPLDNVYFYKKIELHIGKEQAAESQTVTLEQCVGRVDVDLNVSSDYMWRFIRKIDITFDNAEGIYTGLGANGEYSGTEGIESYDITESRSFYSLPSKEALSGVVNIESSRSDGTSFVNKYRFSNCKIEAGRISHISIDYRHPESLEGLLYIREEDFSRFGTDTMFLANEPRNIFYDSKHRSFYANAPLQVSISAEHQLQVKFFSPVTIHDVTILCRFNKISTEFLELAHFDAIYPFMEATFPLPVVSSDRTFTTSSGRKIVIPAQPELSGDDVTFIIRDGRPVYEEDRADRQPVVHPFLSLFSRQRTRLLAAHESIIMSSRGGIGHQYGFHVLFRRV